MRWRSCGVDALTEFYGPSSSKLLLLDTVTTEHEKWVISVEGDSLRHLECDQRDVTGKGISHLIAKESNCLFHLRERLQLGVAASK